MEVSAVQEKLITQLKICRLNNTKPNFAELGRQYGLDWRTVRKYYDGYEGKPEHRNKPSRLDKYHDLIKQKLTIRGTNVRAVYEYIHDEVDEDIGTYSNFNKYVRKKELRPEKAAAGHPRFETGPGVQAQVDWKEDISIANRYGEIFTFQVFDYKLGYSRYPLFIYKLYKTRQDVFDCLIASFKATGGVPKEILFDNMASVVDKNGNRRSVNPKFREFAKDFGFKVKLCKARHSYTKGKVETNSVRIDTSISDTPVLETVEAIESYSTITVAFCLVIATLTYALSISTSNGGAVVVVNHCLCAGSKEERCCHNGGK